MNELPLSSALDEETARAELYGLLAVLYYAPPAPELLAQLRFAPTDAPSADAYLEEPWRALVAAARATDDVAIQDEFDALFGGVGKPAVSVYGSQYLTGFLNEKPLVALRADLARLGLEREAGMPEAEDHFACLCEVMRYLIAGEDVEVANLAQQQAFFTRHLQPWVERFCDAVAARPQQPFYAALAGFTRAFMAVEVQGFDLLD